MNNLIACSDSVHNSTPSNPYCQINAAVGASGKPAVIVAGTTMPYQAINVSPVTLANFQVIVLGPGRAASPPAKVVSNSSPAVTVDTTSGGGMTTLALDGLDLQSTSTDAVLCKQVSGPATLVVKNSFIHDSSQKGVNSSNCTLTLDADLVTGNMGGGVALSSATMFTVTNNIIANNGSPAGLPAPGVSIASIATGTFAFNTVVKNQVTSGIGGIDCGSGGTKVIQNSIAWKNTTNGGTQFGPQCMLTNVVTAAGDDTRGTMSPMPPTFVSTTDFHLAMGDAANLACCVDKVATPGTPNADHDVDNTTRPKGTSPTPYDIGAHEVQ